MAITYKLLLNNTYNIQIILLLKVVALTFHILCIHGITILSIMDFTVPGHTIRTSFNQTRVTMMVYLSYLIDLRFGNIILPSNKKLFKLFNFFFKLSLL